MWIRQTLVAPRKNSPCKPSGASRQGARRVCLEPLEDRRVLSFSPPVEYPAAIYPSAIISADFDADGLLDLATANFDTHDVSVMLGNADGTFQAAQDFAASNGPLSIVTGDLNADGQLDLVTANNADVSVLLGNGNGSFQAPANLDIGSLPTSVAVGDFNADGKLDLGVASNVFYPGYVGYYSYYPGFHVGRANVLLGNGSGGFAAPSVTPLGYGYHESAALADYNGDGKLDFATANHYYGTVAVLPGSGNGTLGTASSFAVASAARSLLAEDVSGDGAVDLIKSNQYSNSVGVLLGSGSGSFESAQFYPTGNYPSAVALADLNNDGDSDLVTANWGDGTLSVLFGDGNGSFKPPVTATAGAGARSLTVGDFNGDGAIDAATINYGNSKFSVLLNEGDWPAADAPTISVSDAAVTEGHLGGVAALFTVSLSASFGQPVTVRYSTVDGTAREADGDYQPAAGTLTFVPGQASTIVSVLVNGDRLAERNESFSLSLSDPVNGFVIDPTGSATIVDDEPLMRIADYVSAPEGNSATPFVIPVSLSSAYDAPITVEYHTAELTDDWIWGYGFSPATADVDFNTATGTLTFAAGETSKSITVMVSGDRLGETDEYFLVNLRNPGSASLENIQSLVQIADDEPVVFFVNNYEQVTEGDAGDTNMNFAVGLSAAYDAPVTFVFTTFNDSAVADNDYLAVSSVVTFAAGQTRIDVPVTVKGDLLAEGYEERFYVQLSNANSALILNPTSFGVILDDDTTPAISISDVVRQEGNSGTTRFVFHVTLSMASDSRITVDYATANGTASKHDNDYTSKSGKLTFAPGETSKTITIAVKGDKKREADESFFVNLSRAVGADVDDSQGEGLILNDDVSRKHFDWIAFALNLDETLDELVSSKGKRR